MGQASSWNDTNDIDIFLSIIIQFQCVYFDALVHVYMYVLQMMTSKFRNFHQ